MIPYLPKIARQMARIATLRSTFKNFCTAKAVSIFKLETYVTTERLETLQLLLFLEFFSVARRCTFHLANNGENETLLK